jgi:hypothetical protein
MLLENLLLAMLMGTATIVIHFLGLAGLIAMLRAEFARRWREGSFHRRAGVLVGVVCALMLLHAAEIWLYAGLYVAIEKFEDFETALYFSTMCFSTLGLGDVVPPERWRLLSSIEAVNGFLLIGWSTAFLVSVTARMGLLEAQLEHYQGEIGRREGRRTE